MSSDAFRALFVMQYLIENDKYVSLSPGDPIRLFPFAKLTRGGKTIDFNKELALQVKLPNYKPAIKLGSHDDSTPSGGNLVELFVGEDGLYGVPEFTDKGKRALEEGDYRYFSPEIYWDGELEDVISGSIEAPVLTGLALLHDPALGGAAALFQADKESDMSDAVLEKLEAQGNTLEKIADGFKAFFDRGEDSPDPDEYAATQKERDEFKAQLEELQAARQREELRATIAAEFSSDEYGAGFAEIGKADGTGDMLASMSEEQREWTLSQLRALSAQINESELIGEEGAAGDAEQATGVDAVDAAVKAYANEHKLNYNAALAALQRKKPEVFAQENE